MSFPKYPDYKTVDGNWFHQIPSNWNSMKGRHLFSNIRKPALVDDEQLTASQKYGVIPQKMFMELEDQKVMLAIGGTENFKHVDANDFVISLRSFQGGIEIAKHSGCVSPAYTVLKFATKNVEPKFFEYLLKSKNYVDELQSLTDGMRDGKSISYDQFGISNIPVPEFEEQRRIAQFLTHQTNKIDTLITEQEKLIELLIEKRQSVISNSVSKGLDQDAKLKNSGVEWLGEIPEHWDVRRLKFLADVQTGDKDTENAEEDGTYPFFVRSQNIERIGSFTFDCEAILTAGDGAGVGKVFHYFNGAFDFHQRVYMLNNFKNVIGKYLFHYFKENFYKVALEGGAKSTVDSLRRPMLMNFPVCIPSIHEQQQIVDFIETQAKSFDQLVSEATKSIEILRERRSALISATVTGQIDVRNHNAI